MPGLLAPPSAAFVAKKNRILDQLAIPDADYTDASPKGSVDSGIRHLIDEINAAEGFVTTSSCAGRVSVFLEGRKTRRRQRKTRTETATETETEIEKKTRHKTRTSTSTRSSHGDRATNEDEVQHGDGDGDENENENEQKQEQEQEREQVAGVGGKGAGGTWLYVSHEANQQAYDEQEKHMEWMHSLGLSEAAHPADMLSQDPDRRLIHFKFEPMILHVLTASPDHAQLLLRCALQAGFRESGAVSIISPGLGTGTGTGTGTGAGPQHVAMPMVAVRSMGLGLESLIGYEQGPNHPDADADQDPSCAMSSDAALSLRRRRIVQPEYLRLLLGISNERFVENTRRIERFRAAFGEEAHGPGPGLGLGGEKKTRMRTRTRTRTSSEGGPWEDAAQRRERKRVEGLRRRAELQAQQQESPLQQES